MVRYNSDGSLDTTFSNDGILITDLDSTDEYIYTVAMQPDGKIVLAGDSGRDFVVLRYQSDGVPDIAFGSGGYVTTDFLGGDDSVRGMAIQEDGRIAVAGYAYNGTDYDFAAARYVGANVRTWTPITIAPGGVWGQTVVVTPEVSFAGTLTNVVQVTTAEGATGMYTETTEVYATTSVTMNFNAGWDLFSLPIDPLVPFTAQTLLDSINAQGGACTEIDRWLNGGWDAHLNGLPFNDFPIELGEGYFIRCSTASDWAYEGWPLTDGIPLDLEAGWNLIGIPYPPDFYTAQSLLDAIASQGGNCSEVDRWLNGGWDAHLDNLPFNDFAIVPDQGYFVKCTQSSTFVPKDER